MKLYKLFAPTFCVPLFVLVDKLSHVNIYFCFSLFEEWKVILNIGTFC